MLGVVEILLIVVILLAGGGVVARAARWALFRRAPGAKSVLSALTGWMGAREPDDPGVPDDPGGEELPPRNGRS